jgi:hypothetical protein
MACNYYEHYLLTYDPDSNILAVRKIKGLSRSTASALEEFRRLFDCVGKDLVVASKQAKILLDLPADIDCYQEIFLLITSCCKDVEVAVEMVRDQPIS